MSEMSEMNEMNELVTASNEMGALIKVSVENGEPTVNARELWKFLEVQSKFADWINNRISQYGFSQGIDFEVILTSKNNPLGGPPSKEYHVTIGMAKELAMVEKNDKGKEARLYFIACEKKAKENHVPQDFAQALQLAADQQKKIQEQQAKLTADKPYTDLAKAITSQDTMVRRDWIAIMKKENGLGAKEKEVTRFLMEEGYLYRDQLTGEARAYAQYADLFKLEKEVINGKLITLLKITGKGVMDLTSVVLQHFMGEEED